MTLPPIYEGPRTPTEQEWPAVTELIRSVFFKNEVSFWDAYRRWPMSLRPSAREHTLTIFREGQPVSTIGRMERDILTLGHRLRMGFIGSVCTHPELRGQGLAGAVLGAVLERFRRDGVDLVYISGTRPMYFGAGANYVAIEERFWLGKEGLTANGPEVELRQARQEDIAQLIALAEAEGTRVIRPQMDWEIVLRDAHCRGHQSALHLVIWQGLPVGYLLLEQDPRRNQQIVSEVAGERLCLLPALRQIAARLSGEERLQVNVPRRDRLGALLRQAGASEQVAANTGGTMMALDFCRTMGKLSPYFQEQLPDWESVELRYAASKDRYTAWCEDGYLQISGEANMLWLLLGKPVMEETAGVLGDPCGLENVQVSGRMRELVERCLPLSLPGVAMNMI